MLFSTISSISISVDNSNSTSAFFRYACHANSAVEKKRAGSKLLAKTHRKSFTDVFLGVWRRNSLLKYSFPIAKLKREK